jgi:cbb3-type cytochrome oxidase maturation protein
MIKIILRFDTCHCWGLTGRVILHPKSHTLSALFILIGISMMVAGSFLAAFIWSVGNGQYDDDYTPSIRMLFDQHSKENSSETTK